jgi:hypothetical protein
MAGVEGFRLRFLKRKEQPSSMQMSYYFAPFRRKIEI